MASPITTLEGMFWQFPGGGKVGEVTEPLLQMKFQLDLNYATYKYTKH